ncbi:M23 family metallopeptidase [Fictibacillus barbaricus]|uniref:Murein DD-endopeptidase MepM/ murein hydrolase activator NlpD n=1 Tax=Fictibacillus barbaricus TaxID=182136 RepID=A0ABU1U1Q6_9BACL|nr:M23 family metallopeptidase [Fictibacillus barbaricus]MDR7073306.1 murein DD-endopeptidase MepM/ murein hydrolase activator NlpD [Fictibacillus barbaricus]
MRNMNTKRNHFILSTVFAFLFTAFFWGSEAQAAAGDNTFIKPTEGVFTSYFGLRNGEYHYGVDMAKSGYVKVIASAPGTVSRSYLSTSYGNVIFIKHTINGLQYETVYAHLNTRDVGVGATVYQGQVIGTMGNTGESTGQHLHFEIHQPYWTSAKTYAMDPMNFIPTWEGKYKTGSFTTQVGTDTIYPISYNGDNDIIVKVDSTSATAGQYKVYLQRVISGSWTSVAQADTPKTGITTVTFTQEDSGSALIPNNQYRLLLKNSDSASVGYKVWYE